MTRRPTVIFHMVLFQLIFTFLCPAMQAEEVARVGSHVLCSSFWISLPERLRHEALSEMKEPHPTFSEPDRKTWEESLEMYRREVAPKSNEPGRLMLSRWKITGNPISMEKSLKIKRYKRF